MAVEEYDHVQAETRAAWRRWLAANDASSPGAWLASWQAATGKPAVGYDAAVEEALCFGWIDSLAKTVDEERTRQLFSPRRPASRWSRSNEERVERLGAGALEAAGLAAVETPKASGAWTELEEVEALVVPADLAAGLAAQPGSAAHSESFPPSVRRGLLRGILDAKRAETRARRTAETAATAASGRRAGQWGR